MAPTIPAVNTMLSIWPVVMKPTAYGISCGFTFIRDTAADVCSMGSRGSRYNFVEAACGSRKTITPALATFYNAPRSEIGEGFQSPLSLSSIDLSS